MKLAKATLTRVSVLSFAIFLSACGGGGSSGESISSGGDDGDLNIQSIATISQVIPITI